MDEGNIIEDIVDLLKTTPKNDYARTDSVLGSSKLPRDPRSEHLDSLLSEIAEEDIPRLDNPKGTIRYIALEYPEENKTILVLGYKKPEFYTSSSSSVIISYGASDKKNHNPKL